MIRRFTSAEIEEIYWMAKREHIEPGVVAVRLRTDKSSVQAVLSRIEEMWQPEKAFNPEYPMTPAYRDALKNIRVRLLREGKEKKLNNGEQRATIIHSTPPSATFPKNESTEFQDLYKELDHSVDEMKLLIVKLIQREARRIAQRKIRQAIDNLE